MGIFSGGRKFFDYLPYMTVCLIVLVFQFYSTSARADEKEGMKRIGELVDSITEQDRYPGVSVAVFLNGELHYTHQAGYADIDSEKAPDAQTVFRMYSLTKGVTQILAAILVDKGTLDLNAPISNYVSNLPVHLQAISAQQLLDNRSGIRHYQSTGEWLMLSQQHCQSPGDALGAFVEDPLIAEPGVKTSYSSFGYVLLSQVMESAAGMPFQELMEHHIWGRVGVERIELDNPRQRIFGNVSTFYEPAANHYVVAPSIDNSCKFGGGAINATPAAMAKIFADFYRASLTGSETLEQFVPAIKDEERSVSFGGEGLGGRSALVAYPAKNLVVVLVANARGGDLKADAENIAKIILSDSDQDYRK